MKAEAARMEAAQRLADKVAKDAREDEREAIIRMIQSKIDNLSDPSWENLNDIILAIRAMGETDV